MIAPALDLTLIQQLFNKLDSLVQDFPELLAGNGDLWINNLSELDELTGDIDETTQCNE